MQSGLWTHETETSSIPIWVTTNHHNVVSNSNTSLKFRPFARNCFTFASCVLNFVKSTKAVLGNLNCRVFQCLRDWHTGWADRQLYIGSCIASAYYIKNWLNIHRSSQYKIITCRKLRLSMQMLSHNMTILQQTVLVTVRNIQIPLPRQCYHNRKQVEAFVNAWYALNIVRFHYVANGNQSNVFQRVFRYPPSIVIVFLRMKPCLKFMNFRHQIPRWAWAGVTRSITTVMYNGPMQRTAFDPVWRTA